MSFKFSKMHGLGNDFMVIDAINQNISLSSKQIQLLADRHFGVGFDQLLLVENSLSLDVDFKYKIFNSDGIEVQQCGNGARCFAKFVYDKGLTNKTSIRVETRSGIIETFIEDSTLVRVNMGLPIFYPNKLPFNVPKELPKYTLNTLDGAVDVGAVSIGNPHIVVPVKDVSKTDVQNLGKSLSSHALLPEGANIGFVELVKRNKLKLRVYERGSEETLACGTGACAAMVVSRLWQQVDDKIVVSLPGGDLDIQWNGDINSPIFMTGNAEYVFDAEISKGFL